MEQQSPKRKRKKRSSLLTIALVVFVTYFLITSVNYQMKRVRLEKEKAALLQQIQEKNLKGQELEDELKKVGSDEYIEYLARKYLGMAYPDEKIVVPEK